MGQFDRKVKEKEAVAQAFTEQKEDNCYTVGQLLGT